MFPKKAISELNNNLVCIFCGQKVKSFYREFSFVANDQQSLEDTWDDDEDSMFSPEFSDDEVSTSSTHSNLCIPAVALYAFQVGSRTYPSSLPNVSDLCLQVISTSNIIYFLHMPQHIVLKYMMP